MGVCLGRTLSVQSLGYCYSNSLIRFRTGFLGGPLDYFCVHKHYLQGGKNCVSLPGNTPVCSQRRCDYFCCFSNLGATTPPAGRARNQDWHLEGDFPPAEAPVFLLFRPAVLVSCSRVVHCRQDRAGLNTVAVQPGPQSGVRVSLLHFFSENRGGWPASG